MGSGFLLFYYTDVVALRPAAAGTMLLFVRLFDAVADLAASRWVDATMSRWGKLRPFLVLGAVPVFVANFAVFNLPADLSTENRLLYAYVSYAAFGVCFSLTAVPYGGLGAAMTQSVAQRTSLMAARVAGGAVTTIGLTIVVGTLVANVTSRSRTDLVAYRRGLQQVFTDVGLVVSVVGCLALWVTAWTCHERVVRLRGRLTLPQSLRALRSNRPLGRLCVAGGLYLLGVSVSGAAAVYYGELVLGNIGLIGFLALAHGVGGLLMVPVAGIVSRFLGKPRTYQVCCLVTVATGVALFAVPERSVVWSLALIGIRGSAVGLISIVTFALEADTVEYAEYYGGERSEGAAYAAFSLTRRVSQAIGIALGAAALTAGRYIAGEPSGPGAGHHAETAVVVAMSLVPALTAAASALVFSRYPLSDDHYRGIRDASEERKRRTLDEDLVE